MSPARPVPEGFELLNGCGQFVDVNGPLFISNALETVQLGFRVEQRHSNPFQTCHGGMLVTFCDMLMPFVAQRTVPELRDRYLPTVSISVDFLGPASVNSWISGTALVLKVTRSMVFMQGVVRVDATAVARTSGIFKIGPQIGAAGS